MVKIILSLIRQPLANLIFNALNQIPITTDAALFRQKVIGEVARILGVPVPPAQ